MWVFLLLVVVNKNSLSLTLLLGLYPKWLVFPST
jgi:hypothetical protein